jgi:outer membrane protein assembly factor BamD
MVYNFIFASKLIHLIKMPSNTNLVKIVIYFLTLSFFISCSEYNKVLKGSDYNLKFDKAIEYYKNDQCYKSLPLLEELMSYFRMTSKGEDVYYYYAKNQYCMGDFYLAGYYFKRFVKNFPQSSRVEECAFNSAVCLMMNSPDYYLDQSESYKAIDEFQLFLSKYPNSFLVDSCNNMVANLRARLERKSFEKGKLYFRMEKFRSAIIALNTTILEFPDTQYKEEVLYLILKSNYLFAVNSVISKKVERFEESIKSYYTFVDSFKNSKFANEAESFYLSSLKELEKLKKTSNGI